MVQRSIQELTPGMILAHSVVDDSNVVILHEGTMLTKAHISRLDFLKIEKVLIKDDYDLNNNYQSVESAFNPEVLFANRTTDIRDTVKEIYEEAAKGTLPSQKAADLIRSDIAPMAKESGAMDFLLGINNTQSDLYQHSIRVAVLAGKIARWLLKPKKEQNIIMLSGLLHDIGMINHPEAALKPMDTLSVEELEDFNQHPIIGEGIIAKLKEFPEQIKTAIAQHHECPDGSGFPKGLTGNNIHEYARIIAIADRYDMLTMEREGAVRQTGLDVLPQLMNDMIYMKIDPELGLVVLKQLRESFLGSKLLMSNGEIGSIVNFPYPFPDARINCPILSMESGAMVDLSERPELSIIEYNPKI